MNAKTAIEICNHFKCLCNQQGEEYGFGEIAALIKSLEQKAKALETFLNEIYPCMACEGNYGSDECLNQLAHGCEYGPMCEALLAGGGEINGL